MNRRQKWYSIFAVLTSVALLGGSTYAVAASDPPSKSDAQSALSHIDDDQAVIQAYLDSLVTPTPTPSASPTVVPTVVPTVTPTASPSPTPTPDPPAGNGITWNSGVWADHDPADATAFATMRGDAVDNIGTFTDRSSWANQLNTWWYGVTPAGYTGDLSIGIPMWPTGNSVTNTGTDAQWKALGTAIAAKDPNAFVRLGWEMNLNNGWNVTDANKANWIIAFNRAADLLHSTGPNLRIVFNPNYGADQTCSNCVTSVFQAVKDRVWSYGVDSYDSYPPANTTANTNARLALLDQSLAIAVAAGKPFSIPEWGVSCNVAGCQWQGNAGGDNPQYVTAYMTWMKSHAAQMGMDSYFNERNTYLLSDLLAHNPNSRAAYKAAF